MAITKAVSQRILVAASIISLLLIAGSIYLHLQQKHHLGRMNLNDERVRPTDGVGTSKHLEKGRKSDAATKLHSDYSDEFDYIQDTNAHEATSARSPSHKGRPESVEDSYIMDNDYNTSIDYVQPAAEAELDALGLSRDCLRCMCSTVNECRPFTCAHIDPCGIYGISKFYWLDGNKPTTLENHHDYNEDDGEHRDYLRCVNNEKCAAETVKNYIKRYRRDCNNDGVIDCQDHIMLHLLGPGGCMGKQLSAIRKLRMKSCLK